MTMRHIKRKVFFFEPVASHDKPDNIYSCSTNYYILKIILIKTIGNTRSNSRTTNVSLICLGCTT